jgi:hypothetical protein
MQLHKIQFIRIVFIIYTLSFVTQGRASYLIDFHAQSWPFFVTARKFLFQFVLPSETMRTWVALKVHKVRQIRQYYQRPEPKNQIVCLSPRLFISQSFNPYTRRSQSVQIIMMRI